MAENFISMPGEYLSYQSLLCVGKRNNDPFGSGGRAKSFQACRVAQHCGRGLGGVGAEMNTRAPYRDAPSVRLDT